MKNPYLYLIMRGDMPSMNPGKLAAQAAHGASMFHEGANRYKAEVGEMTTAEELGYDHWFVGYSDWVLSAKDFGTTIVLTATKDEITNIESVFESDALIKSKHFVFDSIVDPSYPFTMDAEIFDYINGDLVDVSQRLFQNITRLDNGKIFATRPEKTGIWVFGDKEHLSQYIGHLKLYP